MDDKKIYHQNLNTKKNVNSTLDRAGEEKSDDLYKAPDGSVWQSYKDYLDYRYSRLICATYEQTVDAPKHLR